MRDDVPGIVFRSVNKGRFAPAQHRQANGVHARCVDDGAALVLQVPFPVEDRHVEPAVVRMEACRPEDRRISPRSRSRSIREDGGTAVGAKRSGGPTSRVPARVRAHSSNASSSRSILRSASANRLRSPPENSARPSRMAARRPTSETPAALSTLRSSVVRRACRPAAARAAGAPASDRRSRRSAGPRCRRHPSTTGRRGRDRSAAAVRVLRRPA